ncbi:MULTISPECIES: hypothetical protein [Thermoanaerobacterium]|uniref:Uncharacterized protein n=2 Tax=Thermoanaerobacterium TaxID=28895 RepID=W9EDF2_9THEO|nr:MULTISPECIES: hypothetical protein [Thermoanaerobacterium]AFK87413.1 hypothetical protein Tsac_2415 [Thermoanaerobacterium saccharolyticum JW/SL-YS485]ETO37784.1 hypothetical protein V518_2038 [Thermoanaerobacterium aotearoense SCUT27]
MFQIFANGKNITKYVRTESLQIDEAIGERSTCQFDVKYLPGELNLQPGTQISIIEIESGEYLFAGTIDNIDSEEIIQDFPLYIQASIQCADWQQICDRRIVSEAYENVLAGDIVKSIIDSYLAPEGITYTMDSIQDGPTVLQAVFNYVPATDCFDKLSDLAGFNWWIDSNKVFYFCDRATIVAPYTLDGNFKVFNMKMTDNRDNYRNRQYIRAGKGTTDPQTETFKGNGVQKTFTVGFPIALVPTVKVNGIQKTVGIKGVDTGKDWYWNKGDAIITQDDAATPLAATDTLQITYQGLYDVIVLTDDYTAITERQSVEGGTGWYEAVDEEPYLDTSDAAFQNANALLKRYANLCRTLTFETLQSGLHAGQILNVNLPKIKAIGEFLIQKVTYSFKYTGYEPQYRYQIEAASNDNYESWTKFFKANLGQPKTYVIRENIQEQEVLIRLVQQSENTNWSETMTQTLFACPLPSDSLYPSSSLYPC